MRCDEIKECLCCGGSELFTTLDLGFQPPANSFTSQKKGSQSIFPLVLKTCSNCWHSQLSHCLDRELVFGNYVYESGTSKTLNNYFKWFSNQLIINSSKGIKVLDIAANDGSLVKELSAVGFEATGIDPAANLVKKATQRGINVLCGFWPRDHDLVDEAQDLIICMNVLAHVCNPMNFLMGCKEKLAKDGVIFIQPSQARMFDNMEFDTCYHEHISFFNSNSIEHLSRRVGLRLVDQILVKIHGDSPIYILANEDGIPNKKLIDSLKGGDFYINEDLKSYEVLTKLYSLETYEKFSNRAFELINRLRNVVETYRNDGFSIVFVGAAAKAMTVINGAGVVPDYFLDESTSKIGLYPPGLNVKVEPLTQCKTINNKSLFVITAWNFKEELANKLIMYGIPSGSVFYTYFPIECFEQLD